MSAEPTLQVHYRHNGERKTIRGIGVVRLPNEIKVIRDIGDYVDIPNAEIRAVFQTSGDDGQ